MGRFTCTAEHLTPQSEGGSDTADNIRAACWFCNRTRHRMKVVLTPSDYQEYVRKRLAKGKWHPRRYIGRAYQSNVGTAPPPG